MKSLVTAVLTFFATLSLAAEQGGTVQRIETTPDELRDLSINFERLAFTFPAPVLGRFWIEFQSGKKPVQMAAIPNDHVPANTHFALTYVHISDHQVFVSVTTDHDGRSDRRTGSYGVFMNGGTRTVSYSPTTETVPLDKDVELFRAEVKPSWRQPKDPSQHFRIMAHFTSS